MKFFPRLNLVEPQRRIGKCHGREVKFNLSHRRSFELLPGVMKPGFENRYTRRRVTQLFFLYENRVQNDVVFRIHSRDDLKICLD